MKLIIKLSLFLMVALLTTFSMASCDNPNQIGNTYEEPEITVDYLATEYAEQLIRDGAIHFFGSIKITEDENGNPFVTIDEKEIVKETSHPKGYYIADKNLESVYPLAFDARTTHLTGDSSIANIMTSENFVKAIASDEKTMNQKTSNDSTLKYYDIYVIADHVELILAHYLN